ncbi:hypothetical protein LOD99_11391 [Oopsacas minuta]|uniref:Hedgehog protein Hint domain-containing protein n=1 Tax=Oopsacas minuta TaxID=111878 RepID=A0AAV7K384_9METZ|nr:hypothetical protein LOD99_11391 [Oopsacas minuta]
MAERDPSGFNISDQFDQSREDLQQPTRQDRDGYLNLPSTLMQAYAMKTNQHTGMYMVQLSIEAQRACNEAIIFVYGLSGHGKSQSLNHLFGFELIPVGKIYKASDTKSVTEYVAKLVSDTWEVTNLEIGFIDAPGWQDTQGEQQDAKNMATIQQFIENHPHLGSRIYKCYPNIILIAVNATDERIDGPNSSFCKMLNALKHLKIVDKKKPNVIFILTHVMSLPPGNFNEELNQRSTIIKRNCKQLLEIDPMVICLENKPDLFLMPVEGDWTVIEATGERQPLNLFKAMINLMTRNGDEVGVEAVRIYFPNRGENAPREGAAIHPDQVKFDSIQKWRRTINQKNKGIVNDECTKAIKKYEQENKQFQKGTFNPLMLEFNNAGINSKKDIHHKDIFEVQELFGGCILGELEKELIISEFGVRPVNYPEILQELGTGLFLEDNTKIPIHSIFSYAPAIVRNGIMLPACVQIRYCDDTTVVCNCITGDCQMENNLECVLTRCQPAPTDRLLSLRAPLMQESIKLQKHVFKFAIIHNIFRMDLQITLDTINNINDDFKQAIKDLPDPETREHDPVYYQFINDYGNCFRIMLEGGGIISGEIELQIPQENIAQTELLIKNHIQIYLTIMKRDRDQERQLVGDQDGKMVLDELFKCRLRWDGGTQPELLENNLDELQQDDLDRWKRSLHRTPITVDKINSNIETNHIYELVGHFDRNKAKKIKQILTRQKEDVIRFTSRDFEATMLFAEKSQQLDIFQTLPPEPIGPVPNGPSPGDASTRVKAAIPNSITGYPDTSLVTAKKNQQDPDGRIVRIEEVELGDWILCVDQNFNLIYDRISRIEKTPGNFYYHKFGYGENRNFVSGSKAFIMSTNLKLKRADKTLTRDKIYSIITEDRVVMTRYDIGLTKISRKSGNVRFKIQNRVDLFPIVDGIVVGESCFPGNACVVLKGGDRVRMDELKIGDYVLSIHPTTYKPVYSKVPVPAHQLRVGDTIHFLSPPSSSSLSHQQEEEEGKQKERRDSHTLISVPVLHIDTCTHKGYYAPFTNNGLIVVDNIAASVYSHTSTHSSNWLWHSVTSGMVHQFGMHRVGQCVLTPVRVGCKLDVGGVLSELMDTHTHIHKYCQWLLKNF